MRLEGKVALITGAGSGIGRATANRFAAEGASIVASDIIEVAAVETVAAIRESGGEARAVSGDVADYSDARAMVQAAIDAYGKLNVLVNSAGISTRNALPEGASHEDIWDKVMDVNLKGTYLVSWHAVPEMEAAGGGSIINLASIMALVGYPVGMGGGFNPYNASKGGVLQFTRNLAIDMAPKHIRVNLHLPGLCGDQYDAGTDGERGVLRGAEGAASDGAAWAAGGYSERRAVPGVGRGSIRDGRAADCGWGIYGTVGSGRFH